MQKEFIFWLFYSCYKWGLQGNLRKLPYCHIRVSTAPKLWPLSVQISIVHSGNYKVEEFHSFLELAQKCPLCSKGRLKTQWPVDTKNRWQKGRFGRDMMTRSWRGENLPFVIKSFLWGFYSVGVLKIHFWVMMKAAFHAWNAQRASDDEHHFSSSRGFSWWWVIGHKVASSLF